MKAATKANLAAAGTVLTAAAILAAVIGIPIALMGPSDWKKAGTYLSGIGYDTPPNEKPDDSIVARFTEHYDAVVSAVETGTITRVWPLGPPVERTYLLSPEASEIRSAARWAYETQAAGISWQSLVSQAAEGTA